jgi:glycosyltransferase involved in cell wall biosynthesis
VIQTCHEQAPDRRPKLLFLAHPFPPAPTVACVRTWNVTKHLARLGWDVTVVTPNPSLWRHSESAEQRDIYLNQLNQEGIRRILTGHRWRFLIPELLNCWNRGIGWFAGGVCRRIARRFGLDEGIGWIKAAEQACSTLTPNDVDIIFASGSPFSAFKLARILSDKLGRPYVLDYRDPWTGNPHAIYPDHPAIVEKEARLLRSASAVTIVSRAWSLALDQRFGIGSKLQVVTNGYDPEELARVEPHDFGHFAIVYTGLFHPPKRVISPVMGALKCLKEHSDRTSQWYFHYYGSHDHEDHVRAEAHRFDVMDRVVLHGQVPRAEALSAVRGAGVAVVIITVAEKGTLADRGMVTGKLYEALGLNAPILLIAPSGSDAAEIIAGVGAHACFSGSDADGICRFLQDLMRGNIHRCPSIAPRAYAWPELAGQLDKLLRACLAHDEMRP